MTRRILAAIICLLLSACSPSHKSTLGDPQSPGCSAQTLERLYFGSDTPKGTVTDRQWQKFVEKEITPRFPKGFTVIEANGQWLGKNQKVVRQRTRIVEILHSASNEETRAISEILSTYKQKFEQEAVLRLVRRTIACL
ncbi:MAG: DUF3574 domain-containing protein [Deltaproteobacteria bacterium]|nr:DUF3574 domain-containing protein [Deltaproteobacteria bacterium]